MYSYIIKINIKLQSTLSRRQRSHLDLKMREHFTEEVLFYFVSVYKFIICINLQRNWRRQWQSTPVLLPGKPHGRRSLVGCSPWGLPTSLSLFTFMHWRRKWQPTPVLLPGESQGWGSLVGCRLWGHTESDTTEAIQQQEQRN